MKKAQFALFLRLGCIWNAKIKVYWRMEDKDLKTRSNHGLCRQVFDVGGVTFHSSLFSTTVDFRNRTVHTVRPHVSIIQKSCKLTGWSER